MRLARATSLALVLALFGCAGDDGELPSDEGVAGEENGDSKGDRDEAAFTRFEDDVDPGTAEVRKVFTSSAGYEDYFGHAAPADVDWSKDWVVFYAAGGQPTGGYRAEVRRITVSETGKTLKVVTSLDAPGDDCFVTQATTRPYVLVRFARPASDPSRVRFYRDDTTHSCAASQPVVIGDADDGKTFAVKEGQEIVVRLSANPSTGYDWRVVSTNRTFGYPASTEFAASSDAVGAGGTVTMTWKSDGFLSLLGTHHVELAYARGEEVARTFSFTVEITE